MQKEVPGAAWEKPRNYRADIDGLRAIAVSIVILFHAFPDWVPGGFVGVDIFFVISGYLISGIILRELDSQRFSFQTFYANRFRRILPALTLVMLSVWAMGWFALLAVEFKNLGKHLLAGAIYASNFVLWKDANYFDTAANTKPFLHFWSLSVEEQFYAFWPLLLVFWHRRKLRVGPLIAVVGLASFSACLYYSQAVPTQAFYLLHNRLWELLIGASLAAFEIRRRQLSISKRWADFGFALALVLIGAFAFEFRGKHLYPSGWALVPTISALMMIVTGVSSSWSQKILASRPAVLLGQISYPLYLWHWPLLSFALIMGQGVAPISYRVLILAISVLLAWLTWRLLELPVKARLFSALPTRERSRAFILSGTAAIALTAILGSVTLWQNGFTFRVHKYDEGQRSLALGAALPKLLDSCGLDDSDKSKALWCSSDSRGEANAAVILDSHAQALFPGLVANSTSTRWTLIGLTSCAPLQGTRIQRNEQCRKLNEIVLKNLVKNEKIKTVLLFTASRLLQPSAEFRTTDKLLAVDMSDVVFEGFSHTIADLQKAGKRVVFMIDNPSITNSPELCIPRPLRLAGIENTACSISRAKFAEQTREYRELVTRLQTAFPAMDVYDPTDVLCDRDRCNVIRDGRSLYSYTDHLSDYGNDLVAKHFLRWLESGKN